MRLLYLGDIVGRSGREAVEAELPGLKARHAVDVAVVNAENSAAGFGVTEKIANALFAAGADVLVLGNHGFDQKETLAHIAREPRLLRPANYPTGTPGVGARLFEAGRGRKILVVQVLGRVFMEPQLDDPFAAVEAALTAHPLGRVAHAVVVDIHAEATSEKMAMGHFCDGRASLVVGSHSHVPTADAQILTGGTAYQTDAGMCGDYDSVIGMVKDEPLRRFTRKIPGGRFGPAMGPATVCGVLVETDDVTGLAQSVAPIRLGGRLQATEPAPVQVPA